MAPKSHVFIVAGYFVLMSIGLMLWWAQGKPIDWPAWVQAVGSILAILVAVAVFAGDVHVRRDERHQNRAEYIQLVVGLSGQALFLTREVQAGILTETFTIGADNFTDVGGTLDRLPLDRMPSAEFALAFANVRRALRSYEAAYELATAANSKHVRISGTKIAGVLAYQHEAIELQYERLRIEAENLGVDFEARRSTDVDRAIIEHKASRAQA